VIVVYGDDRFSRDEEIRRIKAEQRDQAAGEHNLDDFRAEDLELPRLVAVCGSAPFLSERRVVVVRGLLARALGVRKSTARGSRKKDKAPNEDEGVQEQIKTGLASIPESTLLVLVEDSLNLDRAEALLPKGGARVLGFFRPEGAELAVWVRKRAKAKGLLLRDEATQALVRLGGDDLGRLDGELSKLAAYADGEPVGAEEVRLLGTSQDESIFALLDAITGGRSSDAFASLRALIDQGADPMQILPQVIALVRRLIVAREGAIKQKRADELAGDHDMNPRQLARLMGIARPIEGLDTALQRLLETDRAIKTGAQDPDAALELAVGRVAGIIRRSRR
jgi:DNA polymerase III subunit delta